jgi:membrane-associated phospholipid phosphatase
VTDQPRLPVPPLIPDRARRAAVIVAACCAAVLAAGAIGAAGKSHGSSLDQSVDRWVTGHFGTHLNGMKQIADLGNPTPAIAIAVILILGCLVVRRVNGAILAPAAVLVANGLTELVLKPAVQETIGHPAVLSYPSGHTTSVFTLAAVVVVLLLDPPRTRLPGWLRLALAVVAVAIGCEVAVSLIGIHYHYFTDTVGGACVAIGVVLVLSLALDAPAARARMGRWSFRSGG